MDVLDIERCVGFIDGTPGFEIRCSRITVFQVVEAVFVSLEKIGTQTFLIVLQRRRQEEEALELQGLAGLVSDLHDKV